MLDSAYLVLLFIIPLIEIFRRKENPIDFLTMFNCAFIMWYVLPAFLIAFDPENTVTGSWINIIGYTNKIQTALAIFVGYFFVLIGFYSKSAKKFGQRIVVNARNNLMILGYAIFLLLFSAMSVQIYSSAFGGVVNAITQSIAVRSGTEQAGSLGFFIRFLGAASFSSYLLCAFVFTKDIKTKTGKLLIILSFAFSLVVTVSSFLVRAGRFDVLYYFLGFYQIYILKTRKIPWLFSVILVVLMVLFLFYGKNLFSSLAAIPDGIDAVIDRFNKSAEGSTDGEGFSLYKFMDNFFFTVFSLDTAFGADYEIRWFVDLIYGFLSLVPDRLLGTESPETILAYNTRYITGAFDYSIPTGFLAFGIYSLWWPGLIIVCLTYGWLGGYLQSVMEKHIQDVFWMPSFYTAVAQIWAIMQTADPETFLQSQFILLVSSTLLILVGTKISILRQKS
ncbi:MULTISPECIES: hypothetical protein [unclassified Microcoleus]|uniref:hypothetical protein n=1 Tax=unclassified Microcoleus TaxID=2642155 RepID=UPI002FD198BE